MTGLREGLIKGRRGNTTKTVYCMLKKEVIHRALGGVRHLVTVFSGPPGYVSPVSDFPQSPLFILQPTSLVPSWLLSTPTSMEVEALGFWLSSISPGLVVEKG